MKGGRLDRFIDDGEGIQIPLSDCSSCKHLHEDGVTCDAFPKGVPDRILVGLEQHRKPREGDHGIQYEEVNRAG